MDRKIVLYILLTVAFGFVGLMLLMPEETGDGVVRLPWQVEVDAAGGSKAFGFDLGKTTLAEVRRAFGEEGEVSLFQRPGEAQGLSAEAYFDQIYLSGLRADFVFELAVAPESLKQMYERGLRISQLGSGSKRIKPAAEDVAALAPAPIRSITYLPWKSLTPDVLEQRFGTPAERLSESAGLVHWLYPDKGMDLGYDARGGVVIQYVSPRDFPALVDRLRGGAGVGSTPPPAP